MMPRQKPRNTAAFYVQAALTFGLSLVGMGVAIGDLNGDPWQRAFLAMSTLVLVSSSFTLAKVIRDQQEYNEAYQRGDPARDRAFPEHDPFNSPTFPPPDRADGGRGGAVIGS